MSIQADEQGMLEIAALQQTLIELRTAVEQLKARALQAALRVVDAAEYCFISPGLPSEKRPSELRELAKTFYRDFPGLKAKEDDHA